MIDELYPTREHARSCSPQVHLSHPSGSNITGLYNNNQQHFHSRSKLDQMMQASDLVGGASDAQWSSASTASPAYSAIRPLTKTIWVGNLPPQASTATMMNLFGNAASIESCRIIPHKNCGFVTFFTAEVKFVFFSSSLPSLHR